MSFSKFNIDALDLLISIYIFCIIVSEVMGIKTFPLFTFLRFKLHASVGIFLIPLVFAINDSIIEVYGAKRAKSIYRSGLITIVMLMAFSFLAIKLPPSERFKPMESSYDDIFGQSIRIAIASLTAFTLSDFLDIVIFESVTKRIGKKALWARSNISNFISEFFDTAVFMTLAFYSLSKSIESNALFLLGLIIPYWLLKCLMSIIETPLVYVGVKMLKGGKSK